MALESASGLDDEPAASRVETLQSGPGVVGTYGSSSSSSETNGPMFSGFPCHKSVIHRRCSYYSGVQGSNLMLTMLGT